MHEKQRLLAVLGVGLTLQQVLTAGAAGDKPAAGGETSALPTNADQVDAKIDTSKVKKRHRRSRGQPVLPVPRRRPGGARTSASRKSAFDNVKIVTVEDPLPALIGGSVDSPSTTPTPPLPRRTGRTPELKYLSTYLGGEANILGVRKGINTAEDLKGKTITGGQFGSRNDFPIRKLLTDNGTTPDGDVQAGEHGRRPTSACNR